MESYYFLISRLPDQFARYFTSCSNNGGTNYCGIYVFHLWLCILLGGAAHCLLYVLVV